MANYQKIMQGDLKKRSLGIQNVPGMLNSAWVAVGYLVLIVLAESLITLGQAQAGVILDSLVLVGLMLHASLTTRPLQSLFLMGLSLAPLFRLLSLILPLALFPTIISYLIVGVPMFVAATLIIRYSGLSWREVGLKVGKLPVQLLFGMTGFILGYVEYMILRPAPLVSAYRWDLIGLSVMILFIFTGFLEELTFRGLMQSTALPYLRTFAIPYIAIVFAVLHLGYRSTLDFFFVLGVALFFGWFVHRSGSILGVTLAHSLTNITLYLIVPFMLGIPAAAGVGEDISPAVPPLPTPVAPSNLLEPQWTTTPGWFATASMTGNLTSTPSPSSTVSATPTRVFRHGTPTFIMTLSTTYEQPHPGHPSPTATSTMTASWTPTPTRTPTLIPTDTATSTDTPTLIPTDTATSTDTPTLIPTDTATDVPTDTSTPIPTDTPEYSPTDIPTDTPTEP
jgi:membrane protease YdiL (CAAX protease family)